jgi:hypothetical protein
MESRSRIDAGRAGSPSPRAARLSGNVSQPNHVPENEIAGHKAQRRPGAGEEWLAATKHDGVEVESILINKTKVGEASCQVRSGNFNLPNQPSLQPTYHRLDIILTKCGVGPDRLQRARHNPLRLAPPCRREVVFLRALVRAVVVPITYDLVHAAIVQTARQVAHLLYEVAKERRAWVKFQMVDVAIQGLVHSIDELCHGTKSPPQVLQNSLSKVAIHNGRVEMWRRGVDPNQYYGAQL